MSQLSNALEVAPLQANPPTQVPNPTQTQPAMQPPAENPLDQLRDIHLPDQIDQFPYAPGWWILLAIILIGIGFYLYKIYKYQRAIRLLKPAKAEITELRSLKDNELNSHSIAKLSALLKRICLIYFPRKTVASLNGKNWLEFLNKQANQKTSFFSEADIDLFASASYQANPNIQPVDWYRLLTSSEICIEEIIRTAAKNNPNHLLRGGL